MTNDTKPCPRCRGKGLITQGKQEVPGPRGYMLCAFHRHVECGSCREWVACPKCSAQLFAEVAE